MFLSRFRKSLFAKVIFTAGLVLLVSMLAGAWLNVRYQVTNSMGHVLEGVDRMTNTIRLGTHYAMMGNLRQDIASIIDNTSRQPDIRFIRIYNKSGDIKFTNIPSEQDTRSNIQDEACYVCHQTEPPLVTVSLEERSRIFETDQGRMLAVMTPIYNDPGCSPGPCHYHAPDKQVLGLLDVTVSLASTDGIIADFIRRTIVLDVAIFVATFLAILAFIHIFVNRPLKVLTGQTRRIARGEDPGDPNIVQDDEVGELARAMTKMGRDIRTKHEEIRRQKEDYRRLFELVPCIITVQDRDFRLLSYNTEFKDKFAPKPGQHCYEAYKGRNSKCPDCPVEKTFETGASFVSEEEGYSKDGSEAHWIVTTSPIKDPDGTVTAAMEVCLDITPRKRLAEQLERTEQRYQAIFDSIPNPVFVLDKQTLTVLDCNDAVAEVYGLCKQDVLDTPFLDLFPEEEREHYAGRISRGEAIDQARQLNADNLPVYVQIRVNPTEYDGREALLLTLQDITKRLDTEQQLIQASKMATLGEMATGVAHELNQPLSVIKTASSFFMNKINKNQPIREDILLTMAQEIDAHVDRATKIIRHMREFGRKPELSLDPVDVNQVLERAFEIFSQQLKLRQIEVVWKLAQDLPPVMADAQRLEQVFINLLINARDAIEEKWENVSDGGSKRIDLTTRRSDGYVVVEVADTGLGIPKALRDKIFEPFFTTKKVGKGTGLGLSITYGIIQDCGGTITVANKKTGGAKFTLSFPVHTTHE